MKYLLYLKQSFLRRPSRHLTLYAIMTCAFILPLLFSIYLDSSEYGRSRQLLSESKGETFHITTISEEDCELFENIEGLSAPYYEDGIIYLHIIDDKQWQDPGMMDYYGGQLMQRIERNSKIAIRGFDYEGGHGILNSEERNGQKTIQIFLLIIMVITSYIIKSAYQSHLNKFRAEVGTLCACGANDRQIMLLFFVEYIVLYVFSSVSAILISVLVMKALFKAYLEISGIKWLAWVIFRMDPLNTAVLVALYGVVLFIVLFGSLRRFGKESVNSLIQKDEQTELHGLRWRCRIRQKTKPENMLANIWKYRTGKIYQSCLCVSIPVVSLFLFLFCYLSADIDTIEKSKEYELRLTKMIHIYGGFTQTEIDLLSEIDNVEGVKCEQENLTEIFATDSGEDSLFIDTVWIKLQDKSIHQQTSEEIRKHFEESEFFLDDFEEKVDYARVVSKGIYLMLVFLFLASFVFILIILCVKLYDYMENNRKNIRILLTIGASKKTIYCSYMIQTIEVAAMAVIGSVVASIMFVMVVFSNMEETVSVNLPLIAAYMISAVAVLGAYVLPIHYRLKSILNEYH